MSDGGDNIGMGREALAIANDRLVAAVLAEGGFPTKVTLSDGRWAWAAPDRRAWNPGRPVRERDINLRQSWPLVAAAGDGAPARREAPVQAARRPDREAWAPRAARLATAVGGLERAARSPEAPPRPVPAQAKARPATAAPSSPARPTHAVRLVEALGQLGRGGAPELAQRLGWTVDETRQHLVKLGVLGVLQGAGKNAAGDRLWRLSGKPLNA